MQRIRSEPLPLIAMPSFAVAELRRCDDHFFRKTRSLSMPIELRNPRLYSLANRRGLGLPQIYAALSMRTGPSGDLYDDWKGAFSFPFKLTVRRGDRELRYLLNVVNFRSMVEPVLYRVQQPGESYSTSMYHAPFDDELSTDDVVYIIDFLCGFIEGYLEAAPRAALSFVKEVQSNFILFGYNSTSGEFFEEDYDTKEEYQAALERYRRLIPKESPERELVELDW